MVEYSDPALMSLIDRTLKNYKYIEDASRRDEAEVFEVTQLLNSLAGLLIYPKDSLIAKVVAEPLEDSFSQEYLPKVRYGELRDNDTRGLIKYLRNGFAHFNTEFENENGEIKGIYVWNFPNSRKDSPDWVAYISVCSMRYLACEIASIFKRILVNDERGASRISRLESNLSRRLRITGDHN